jgi:DNA-binding GntR family transcriptional regulator
MSRVSGAAPEAARCGREGEVVAAVEEDVIFGRLAPGARITEDALLARFPVTRHVARQALFRLERMGIVVRERNKGAAVLSLSEDEVRQLYEVRELAQRQAALSIPVPAPAGLVDELRAIHDAYCAAIDAGLLRRVHELNDRFHLTLFSACGNRYLVETIEHYMQLSLTIRAKSLADRAALQASREQHRLMIELLGGRDRWAVAQLCVEHLQPSKADYLQRIRR